MRKLRQIALSLSVTALSGCVFFQMSNHVSLAGAGESWFLYVESPTSDFEFSMHGLFFGNVPDRYRIALPGKDGIVTYEKVKVYRSVSSEYSEEIPVTAGAVTLTNCIAKIDLSTSFGPLSFNGDYELSQYDCRR